MRNHHNNDQGRSTTSRVGGEDIAVRKRTWSRGVNLPPLLLQPKITNKHHLTLNIIVNTKYHHYHQNIIIIIRPSEQWEHAGADTWFSDFLPTESSKQARRLSPFKMQMYKFYK